MCNGQKNSKKLKFFCANIKKKIRAILNNWKTPGRIEVGFFANDRPPTRVENKSA